jgi:signal transduction histidine kinase
LVRYAATLEQLTISQERNRLARELHDTLAHTLSGLAVHLDAIFALWKDVPPRAQEMIQQALTITREGLDETRRAMKALRATPLEQEGLALAVRSLAESAAQRGGLSLQLDVDEHPGLLGPEVEQCYYRVAQEAIENVVTHAGARTLSVSLRRLQDMLVLEVADDGRGLARTAASHEVPGQDVEGEVQFGLRGMRERAELIGGTLDIEGRPGKGTTIRLSSAHGSLLDRTPVRRTPVRIAPSGSGRSASARDIMREEDA